MKRFSSYHFVLYFMSLFFLLSCEKDNKPVSSGVAQSYKTILSKSCSKGSLTVKVKTISNVSSTGQITLTKTDQPKVGDEVEISGKINKSLCKGSNPLTFSCKGTVAIDTNRVFRCFSGTLGLGTSSVSTGSSLTGQSTSLASPLINSTLKFLTGEFHTYQNGTGFAVTLAVQKGTYRCPTSFVCE